MVSKTFNKVYENIILELISCSGNSLANNSPESILKLQIKKQNKQKKGKIPNDLHLTIIMLHKLFPFHLSSEPPNWYPSRPHPTMHKDKDFVGASSLLALPRHEAPGR